MQLFSWLRQRTIGRVPNRRDRKHGPALRPRLCLEALEERYLLSTLTVLNTNDSGAGSLRADIAAASSGDTIQFAKKLTGDTISLTQGQLAITKNLDIEGLGAANLAISGNAASRVFAVSSGVTATLAGLTIRNGLADQGGGIDNAGVLTLNGDVVSHNEALGDSSTTGLGGGVFNEAVASLTVNRSTFLDNQAVGSLGLGWGGGLMNEGSCSLTGSTFTGNQAIGGTGSINGILGAGVGGAINNCFGALLTVTSSSFNGNQAIDGLGTHAAAGAISTLHGSSLTVSSSTFTGNLSLANSTSSFAGAIVSDAVSPLSVAGSSFTGNQAIGFSQAWGGALVSFGPCSVTSSTFTSNEAIATGPGAFGLGGAIYFANLANSSGTSMSVTNSTITGNEALGGPGGNGSGGGLIIGLDASVTIDGCTISGNVAQGGAGADGLGGGLWIGGATVCINNSSITDNQAVGGAPGTNGGAGQGEGGGIYVHGPSTVGGVNTDITGNWASTNHDDVFGNFDPSLVC
jgi:hypothetical protein